MKAAWYEDRGPASEVIQIGEIKKPEIGKDGVLVRVYASGVNPSDVKKRAVSRGEIDGQRIIPHSDGAGIVEAVGSDTSGFKIGDRVWMFNAQFERTEGTAAELVSLPSSQLAHLPERTGFLEGATLGIPAMTAHRCLYSNGNIKGETVLVTGGAGAVGNYAIQLAKWGGANVITTVSTDQKAKHAALAGPDHILNYRTDDVVDEILQITNGEGVDKIVEVDFGTNLPITEKLLKVNGTIACYASMNSPTPIFPFYNLMFKNIQVQLVLVYNMLQSSKLKAANDINKAINEDKLFHPVASIYSLDQTAEAHLAVESGTNLGTTVIDLTI